MRDIILGLLLGVISYLIWQMRELKTKMNEALMRKFKEDLEHAKKKIDETIYSTPLDDLVRESNKKLDRRRASKGSDLEAR